MLTTTWLDAIFIQLCDTMWALINKFGCNGSAHLERGKYDKKKYYDRTQLLQYGVNVTSGFGGCGGGGGGDGSQMIITDRFVLIEMGI